MTTVPNFSERLLDKRPLHNWAPCYPCTLRLIGADTRDNFTVVKDTFTAGNGLVRVTGLSRDKFTMGNSHSYVKKKPRKKPPMEFNMVNN